MGKNVKYPYETRPTTNAIFAKLEEGFRQQPNQEDRDDGYTEQSINLLR